MSEWQPIETAPRDGTTIDLTWMEDGRPAEIWPMHWDDEQTNGLFPGCVGMWINIGASLTWAELPGGGPTHWRPHRPRSYDRH